MSNSSFDIFQTQQTHLQKLQLEQPELFVASTPYSEDDALPRIGIHGLPADRPEGFLRLFPQDFIVEEIRPDGISTIESQTSGATLPDEDKITIYADMIKVGISTLEAIKRLASTLEIDVNKIGYAGIKDAQALTSQRIAISGLRHTQLATITQQSFESFFLTNFSYSKGTIARAQLTGNRFTIFVRTDDAIDQQKFQTRIETIKKTGVKNYYNNQRFGMPRLISHYLGGLICRGDYAGAIKTMLTMSGTYDIPLIINTRQQALEHYGDWQMLEKIFSELPYTFQNELLIVKHLQQRPDDYIGALYTIKDQATLWIYSYASWVFNEYLSVNSELPTTIPLLYSNDDADHKFYQKWLDRDQITDLEKNLRPFKFIQFKKRLTPTHVIPQNVITQPVAGGIICHFSLDKGAYATTLLMNLFKLRQGFPLPDWLNQEPLDTKKVLGIGSCEPALEVLEKYVFSLTDRPQAEKEAE